jgi:hypothetical protein
VYNLHLGENIARRAPLLRALDQLLSKPHLVVSNMSHIYSNLLESSDTQRFQNINRCLIVFLPDHNMLIPVALKAMAMCW